MAQQTQVNGNRYSFVNISVNLNGTDMPRIFKSINYKATQDPGIVQGNQVTMVGRTAGYATGSGSFEAYVSELDDFYRALVNSSTSLPGGPYPIMSIDFDIAVSYDINGVDTRTDYLFGCRITDLDSANQQGNDASSKTNTLSIARLKLNGIDAFADPTSF